MLSFIQQILAFATFEVLEPNWRKLEGKLEAGKVETVDQLLRDHVDFLDTCLKECMLTSSKLVTVRVELSFARECAANGLTGNLETNRHLLHVLSLCCVLHKGGKTSCILCGKPRDRSSQSEEMGHLGQV